MEIIKIISLYKDLSMKSLDQEAKFARLSIQIVLPIKYSLLAICYTNINRQD